MLGIRDHTPARFKAGVTGTLFLAVDIAFLAVVVVVETTLAFVVVAAAAAVAPGTTRLRVVVLIGGFWGVSDFLNTTFGLSVGTLLKVDRRMRHAFST